MLVKKSLIAVQIFNGASPLQLNQRFAAGQQKVSFTPFNPQLIRTFAFPIKKGLMLSIWLKPVLSIIFDKLKVLIKSNLKNTQ
jgi:hypothetical protein